ncbi:MAG: DUF948 domain-containing protein [Syntrophales bacterium]|nr:DUF948 domain-containing protein [Syntrophales bacterium]MDD5232301.1 DUF948 domain-containing protein [Syntrophales bacterium]
MDWEISLTIISLSFFLLTLFVAFFILQVLKTARNIEAILEMINGKLPGILSDIKEVTGNLTASSVMLKAGIEGLTTALGRVRQITSMVDTAIRPGIETPVLSLLKNAGAIRKGIQIFLKTLGKKG